jgi:outer membrane cobalamin receptor
MNTTLRFVLFVVLASFSSDSSRAQTHPSPATVSGTLTDSSGAGVAGASITAETLDSSAPETYRTVSGSDGRYTMTLPSGRVRVRITQPSFTPREFTVSLAPGESKTLDARLEIERLASSVVVTAEAEPLHAERSPAPATILSRTQLDERQAPVLTDLLLFTPGVSLGRNGPVGGLTSLFLDGGNSNFTKILVDGTTVNESGGVFNFSNFTLDNVDKVEVVHGAESALYGTDAVSGVIQVFTHRGTTRTPELTVFGEAGAFSSARGGARLSALLGRFDYSAAAAYFQTEGQGPNDFYVNRSLSGNFGWRLGDSNQVRLVLRNHSSSAGIPGPTLFLPPNLDASDSLHVFSANLSWEFHTGSRWLHRLSAAESRTDDVNVFSSAFSPFHDQFNRAGFQQQSTFFYGHGSFTAGYQYEVENGSPGGPHVRRNNQGGFLDARWLPLARVTLSAGLRAEANDSFGTRVVPRVGLALALRYGQGSWGDTRLRVSYGQGIKEPRLDQSFGTDPCDPGNPSLRPERSRTVYAGIEQLLASNHLRISATYFDNRFRDIVSFAFGPVIPGCPFGTGTFFNTDRARAQGVNMASETRPWRWLTLAGNYSYDDTRVLESLNSFGDPALIPGNHLLRRPVHSGSLVLNAAFHRMNWNLAGYFSGPRTDSNFTDPAQTKNPGYSRFDLAASYDLGRGVSLYGRVTNLFDKDYQDALGYPALGRDFRLGMRYTLRGKL